MVIPNGLGWVFEWHDLPKVKSCCWILQAKLRRNQIVWFVQLSSNAEKIWTVERWTGKYARNSNFYTHSNRIIYSSTFLFIYKQKCDSLFKPLQISFLLLLIRGKYRLRKKDKENLNGKSWSADLLKVIIVMIKMRLKVKKSSKILNFRIWIWKTSSRV